MIGYRFLDPAEKEMTEASLFYQAASRGLGNDFLDDVQRVVDNLCEHPLLGRAVARNLRMIFCIAFPLA
ncbi:MAG: type II toxin-antitoxin system RelE/ParE family toxin [Acidobacteriota bacterium]